ncbi:MAG: hypothetical protein WD403_13660, partial [Pirellulales bacterium]
STGVMLGQALNLVNGPTFAEAIADPKNRIAQLVGSQPDDAKVIEEIFMSVLCREPSAEEVAAALDAFKAAQEDQKRHAEELAAYERDQLPVKQAEWEKSQAPVVWQPLDLTTLASAGGATLTRQDDGSILVAGENPPTDKYTLAGQTDLTGITGIRLEVLPDDSLPAKGPGRAGNGNFVLNEIALTAAPAADAAQAKPVALKNAQSSFAQEGTPAAKAIDGDPKGASGWAISPKFGEAHVAVFETAEAVGGDPGTTLTFTLEQQFGSQHTIGRLRLSVTGSPAPLKLEGPPAPIAAILAVAAEQRTPEQQAELSRHYRTIDPELVRLTALAGETASSPDRHRLVGAQDVAWALLNSPAFLFNR